MVIDTSALVELFSAGPHAENVAAQLAGAKEPKVSSVCVLEVSAILRRQRGREAVDRFLEFLVKEKIKVIPFDGEQLLAALLGDAAYGDGSDNGMATGTNLRLAELCTYGLAKHLDEAVLHANINLRRTDLEDA